MVNKKAGALDAPAEELPPEGRDFRLKAEATD
jgi:hypothetical protein